MTDSREQHVEQQVKGRVDGPVALVTGGSAGLGRQIAAALWAAGYHVVVVGRSQQKLEQARERLLAEATADPPLSGSSQTPADSGLPQVVAIAADVGDPEEVARAFADAVNRFGRLDVLVNNVGMSDRGTVENLTAERLQTLIAANVTTALLCSQAALPALEASRGTIVNIGSLAAKVGARYLGGYPAAKHALAGLTQQMRLEWKPRGVHVALLNPGPIRRDDEGKRYESQLAADSGLPEQAARPGGGTRVKGLPPQQVAAEVVRIVRRRSPDVLRPSYLRPLVAIGHLWPSLGDWLLLRFTSSKSS
ncbi:SDR family NAD(P)-dependent oxidoreductase [Candidatus Laterigemmans baculatus]|uniref:SDR family NAD(P)-dependent oxidoreductase n=1 Tax=Candidatus Laterigemmans baculatus TaxID=2770505 RepID=UPI0013DD5420|nr:SDR family oxidoreductase [Candidatus Laterigemmans baculatus]